MALFNIFESLNITLFNFNKKNKNSKNNKEPQNVKQKTNIADKILEIFEMHGVKNAQIPKFFDHNISIKDTSNSSNFLNVINDEIIDDVCNLFNINPDWLYEEADNLYTTFDFYKSSYGLQKLLQEKKLTEEKCEAIAILPQDSKKDNDFLYGLIIILEKIGYVNNKYIYKPYILEFESIRYWRSYGYFLQSIADISKAGINVSIKYETNDKIKEICYKDSQPVTDDIYKYRSSGIYYEDLINNPEILLTNVDKEIDNYGHIQAINFWLDLYKNNRFDNIIGVRAEEFEKYFIEKHKELKNKNETTLFSKIKEYIY